MILFFSGTGNSAYVAEKIAQAAGEDPVDLLERFRGNDTSDMYSETPWVVVTPTYAWRIPRILQNWIKKTNLTGNRNIFFVMTCGGSIGNADKYLKSLCASKQMEYRGCFQIVMPENYIALFPAPDRREALEIIDRAEGQIEEASRLIRQGSSFPKKEITWKDRISSGIVNDLYYPAIVHAKNFFVTDSCISCGHCVNVCPMNNIRLEAGKPVWGAHCTHCMACICRCPKEAVEYGKNSAGRVRYTCPK